MELRQTGISAVGDVPWGTHFCIFYASPADLLDVLVPYFRIGLENNEYCLCALSRRTLENISQALRESLPDFDRYAAAGAVEIVAAEDWYGSGGDFDPTVAMRYLREKLASALTAGFTGVRANGDEAWLQHDQLADFCEYEKGLGSALEGSRMIVGCSYRLDASPAAQVLDVAQTHEFVLAKRESRWERLELAALKQTKEELTRLSVELERRVAERTRQLEQLNATLEADIAMRQRIEVALRESEERFEKAFRACPVTNTITRARDGVFIDVNDAFLRMFGYERTEVIGRTALELGLWADPLERRALMGALSDKGAVRGYEARALTKSGRGLELLVFVEPIELDGEGCLLIGAYDQTARKHAERALRDASERLKALSRRTVDIQEAERRQLSRALHDRIGQNLTALGINLNIVTARLSAGGDAAVVSRLRDSIALVQSTADAIVDVLTELRPPMLDDLGLLSALEWYAAEYSTRTGIEVAVVGDDPLQRLSSEAEIALFRIAQEALNNVVKHARARHVDIEITANGEYTLSVSDDGVGLPGQPDPDSPPPSTFGMATMRERALAVGGRFEILDRSGGGTSVVVRLPSS
jgi:PAS domain S-box-containing protein